MDSKHLYHVSILQEKYFYFNFFCFCNSSRESNAVHCTEYRSGKLNLKLFKTTLIDLGATVAFHTHETTAAFHFNEVTMVFHSNGTSVGFYSNGASVAFYSNGTFIAFHSDGATVELCSYGATVAFHSDWVQWNFITMGIHKHFISIRLL